MMDAELNVTYITIDGYVELHKYRCIYFMIMFIVYILIICCNSTIVCLIWIHKNLHEPMYIFIAALLFNSVLYSTNIYPKLLIDFLTEEQTISYSACLFQFFLFYSLGGSEFLLLVSMAYDRYVSICKPLQYHTIMRKSTVNILLLLDWLLPPCAVLVLVIMSLNKKLCNFTLTGIFCNNSIYKLQCVSSAAISIYGAVNMLIFVIFPCFFVVFTYTQIFIVAYQSSRDVRKKAADTCLPHLMVLITYSCCCTYDIIVIRLEANIPKVIRLIMTLQVFLYHPLFNPIIYGVKMKEVSKHLKRLFSKAKQISCTKTVI